MFHTSFKFQLNLIANTANWWENWVVSEKEYIKFVHSATTAGTAEVLGLHLTCYKL